MQTSCLKRCQTICRFVCTTSLYDLPFCLHCISVSIFDLVGYADKSSDFIGRKFLREMRHFTSTLLVCIGRTLVCKQIQLAHIQTDVEDAVPSTQSLQIIGARFRSP